MDHLISRRSTLAAGGAAVWATWSGLAFAKNEPKEPELPPLPKGLQGFSSQDDFEGAIDKRLLYGTRPPMTEEEKIGQTIIDGAKGARPYEVAQYFLSVATGSADLAAYTRAWPVRWNPVIVEFFRATKTKPSGDTTAWCAAFTNWCLLRAASQTGKQIPLTRSAAAKSFRIWGDKTETPQVGDIAVFKNVQDPDHGHVGFYAGETATSILVLGGNQFEGTPRRHAINLKPIKKNGSVLALHSVRTHEALRA